MGSLRRKHAIPAFDPQTRSTWLTLTETSERLGVSEATVLRFIRRGILPASQAAPGTPWIVQPNDLCNEDVLAAAAAVRQHGRAPPSDPGQTQLPFESGM